MLDYKEISKIIDWKKIDGLVPVIVQDENKNVLTLGYMNKESLKLSIDNNKMYYYSRTKKRIRMKGEESGNIQLIKSVYIDCDNDALLFIVKQINDKACHEGNKSCFRLLGNKEKFKISNDNMLYELEDLINDRKMNPEKNSYTNKLFKDGKNKIYKKFGEESIEIITAIGKKEIIYETADMLYHLLILLSYENIKLEEIMVELKRRRK